MKLIIGLLISFASGAQAADHCSMGLAKKFARAIIDIELQLDGATAEGQLIFSKNASREYTTEYLAEQAELSGEPYAKQYLAMKKELEDQPGLHIYRLQYKWKAANGLDYGFYYMARLKNYDRGCAFVSLVED